MPDKKVAVSVLDAKRQEYKDCLDTWRTLDILRAAGWRLKAAAQQMLRKRPKERQDIFYSRADALVYQNILGTIVGWYGAKLFRSEPKITDGSNPDWSDPFYAEFLQDCDRGGKTYLDFWREQFKDWFMFGCSYALVDLPRTDEPVDNRADEKERGLDRQYLVKVSPLNVINWAVDDYGNLKWIVIASQELIQDDAFTAPKTKSCWYIFDQQNFYRYEADAVTDSGAGQEKTMATLVDSGQHALAGVNRVPVRRYVVPDDLWLGNRIYLQLIDHLIQENTYGWALFMANMAMPVIIGPYNAATVVTSETSFLHLPDPQCKFQWMEPEGRSFEHSAVRLNSIREEIYRSCHLQAQGRSSAATPAMQSGYSKEVDMQPSSDMLNEYGARISAGMELLMHDIADSRSDAKAKPTVNGLRFETRPITEEIAVAQEYFDLGIDIPTAERAVVARVVSSVMDGESEEDKAEAFKEVESMQTKADQAAADKAAQVDTFAQSLKQATAKQEIKTEQGALAAA